MAAFNLPIHVTTPGTRARLIFEVTAGVVPGNAMPEYTRRWAITSEQWEKDMEAAGKLASEDIKDKTVKEGPMETSFHKFQYEAFEYARNLMHPAYRNWVRVDWIWF